MKTPSPEASALVLVDYQQRLLPAIHGGAMAMAAAAHLADMAREMGIRVHGTEQNPEGLGPNHDAIRNRCDDTLAKMHFNACSDGLLERLRADRDGVLTDVVIAGCEAHVCLLQTAIGLLDAGLSVWVVGEACGSRRAENHALAMMRLTQAGALIVSSEMMVFEWLRTCEHPRFKTVLAMLKTGPALPG